MRMRLKMSFMVVFAVLSTQEAALATPTIRVHPILPLENLTLSWAYYNKYLRQHLSHLIDSLPISVSTQNGDQQGIVTPKDIRKGVSDALDLMPFANRTAFELEIERLRTEASNAQHRTRPSNQTILTIQNIHYVGNFSNASALDVAQDARPGSPTVYVGPQTLTIESLPAPLMNVSEGDEQPESSYYNYEPPGPPPKRFPTKVSHRVVPMPLPVVRVQPVYYPIYRPIIHERPVPVPHYIPVPRPVPQPFPQYIPVPRPVPQPIPIPKPVPYPVPKPYPVPVPLPPQAIPVPIPQPYPVPVSYFPPGMTGAGQGQMYNPQFGNQNYNPYFNNGQFPMSQGQPGQGVNYPPRQPMPQMPQDQRGGVVDVQRRSREPLSKSGEPEKKPHKSSLMRFILNVDD